MEEFNTYEYSVEHSKKDRKLRLKKFCLIMLYVLYGIGGLTVAAIAPFGVLLAPFIALVPVTCWMIVFFTWRYVKPEYIYTITLGTLKFIIFYGSKTKRTVFEAKIANADMISPYTEKSQLEIEKYAPKNIYFGASSLSSPDTYYMLFKNDKEEACVYFFEATSKALKILKFYNSHTEVANVRF